jgi:hypothetical protein
MAAPVEDPELADARALAPTDHDRELANRAPTATRVRVVSREVTVRTRESAHFEEHVGGDENSHAPQAS